MRRHRLIVCVDIEGSSDSSRTDLHRKSARGGMYEALRRALGACGEALEDHYHEDRGDGAFVLLPADVPKDLVLTEMPRALVAALSEHNREHAPQEQVRLRVAFNHGEVDEDRYGVIGDALNTTFRLVDSPALKRALAASPGLVAVIASERIYHDVIWHFPATRPEIYRRIPVKVKNTDTTGWICLPDAPDSLITGDRSARPDSSPEDIANTKDLLAGRVEKERSTEVGLWFVDSPVAMPVRWRLTDRDEILDNPDNIASTEIKLAGSSDQIAGLTRQFRGLRRRRLVIMGGAGTGKTTLAMQLLLDLLKTRSADEPVPVMFSVAGWNTETSPRLHEWLAEQLARDYPFLRARDVGADLAKRLVDGGHILPVLDGLDDLPDTARAAVIWALNESLRTIDQLILTSRATEYGQAVKTLGRALESAAVIEPEPLAPEAAAGYLRRCLPKDPGPVWDRVLRHMTASDDGGTSPLAETAATPLGLWLLRINYIGTGADPARLLDRDVFPDAVRLRTHLYDRHIRTVIDRRPPSGDPTERTLRPRRRYDPEKVGDWLGYLADRLGRTGTRDLAWWRIAREALPPRAIGSVVGLTIGVTFLLASGLAGTLLDRHPGPLVKTLSHVSAVGLVSGLTCGFMAPSWLDDPPGFARLNGRAFAASFVSKGRHEARVIGLLTGVVAGAFAGILSAQYDIPTKISAGRPATMFVGTFVDVIAGLIVFVSTSVLVGGFIHLVKGSLSGWRKIGLVITLALSLTVGLVITLLGWYTDGLTYGFKNGLLSVPAIALSCGLVYGVVSGLVQLVKGIARELTRMREGELTGWRTVGLLFGLPVGLLSGLEYGLMFSPALGLILGLEIVLVYGVLGIILFVPVDGFVHALEVPTPEDLASTPLTTWRADRRLNALRMAAGGLIGVFLLAGVALGWPANLTPDRHTAKLAVTALGARGAARESRLSGEISHGPASDPATALATGLFLGLTCGLVAGRHHAWQAYVVGTYRLARAKRLPRRLLPFLDDMHRLGLLRTVGPMYQFRHAELQDHLAATYRRRERTRPPEAA